MMTRIARLSVCCLVSVFLLTAGGACSKEKEAKSTAPADTAKSVKTEAEPTAEVEAVLAKADLVDGKADKIVTRCAGCGLKMDGSSEHTLKASGYTLYFCSEKCATEFSKDMTKSILAMKIPEVKMPETKIPGG